MKKITIALLAFLSLATFAFASDDEIPNHQLLDSALEQLKTSLGLDCQPGRNPGSAMNPLVCGLNSCRGTVRFTCRDSKGDKQFKVHATYIYGGNMGPVALKRVMIKALD